MSEKPEQDGYLNEPDEIPDFEVALQTLRDEVAAVGAEKAQLEATVEALQGRELELSRELISYLKAERAQLRRAVED